jgi:Tfp pilus assembly protein PilN
MIKINLLPSHVAEGRKARRLLRLVILVLLVEAALCGWYFTTLNSTITTKTEELATAKQQADTVRALQQQVDAAKVAAAPVQANLAWYNSIYAGPKALVQNLKNINDYIYAKLTVKSLTFYGNNVDLQTVTKGSVNDLNNLSTAYLNLLRSPHIDPASVQFNPTFQVSSQTAGPRGRGRSRGGDESGLRGGRRRGRGRMMDQGNMTMQGPATTTAAPAFNPNETMSISFTFSLKSQAGADASAAGGFVPAGRGGRRGAGRRMGGFGG